LDQPIMSIKELDISPGSVFQIAVTPTLMDTTAEAKKRFTPIDRGCYVEGELPLKYLPDNFYRYEMSNCLFEAAYEKIIEECHCMPSFHQLAHKDVSEICTGPGLTCMNKILRFIGKLNKVGPGQDICLSACTDQINNVGVTSSDFPNRETFVKREEFCITLMKLKRTCQSEKAAFLIEKFPSVCQNIQTVMLKTKEALNISLCDDMRWDRVRRWDSLQNSSAMRNLEEDIFQYAKKNLAVVNVYIKEPVVTKIMRDQKIPVIAFVANTGGLLGLCMGFSLVSVFEIIYHVFGALKSTVSNWCTRKCPCCHKSMSSQDGITSSAAALHQPNTNQRASIPGCQVVTTADFQHSPTEHNEVSALPDPQTLFHAEKPSTNGILVEARIKSVESEILLKEISQIKPAIGQSRHSSGTSTTERLL